MPHRVLLLVLDNWYTTARLPFALKSAGFEVGLVAQPGAMVSQSLYLDRSYIRRRQRDQRGWLAWLRDSIVDFQPDFIMPADEDAVRVCHFILLHHRSVLPREMLEILERSIGDVKTLPDRSHRDAVLRRARRLGIEVPAGRIVRRPSEAEAFLRRIAGPVVLKTDHSFGGLGVMMCEHPPQLRTAYGTLSRQSLETGGRPWARLREIIRRGVFGRDPVLEGASRSQLRVEAKMAGKPVFHTAVARDGVCLDGFSADVELCHPLPTGPSTRVHLHHCPQMAAQTQALVADLGFSGVCGLDFLRGEDGRLTLLEFNQRPTSVSYLGHHVGADVFSALADGQVRTASHRGNSTQRVALFPQDWLRDPMAKDRSAFLIDRPEHEPRILQTMQARIDLVAAARAVAPSLPSRM